VSSVNQKIQLECQKGWPKKLKRNIRLNIVLKLTYTVLQLSANLRKGKNQRDMRVV